MLALREEYCTFTLGIWGCLYGFTFNLSHSLGIVGKGIKMTKLEMKNGNLKKVITVQNYF